MIPVTEDIRLAESEIQLVFIRASGPGGQHVNKASTAVQLRFDAARSKSLTDDVRRRLLHLAGSRATRDGTVVIDARRFRSQEQNRSDAVERLVRLIRRAVAAPRSRRHTRPSASSVVRRLDRKRRRSETKRLRGPIAADRAD
jgi:ribosome-associated protein